MFPTPVLEPQHVVKVPHSEEEVQKGKRVVKSQHGHNDYHGSRDSGDGETPKTRASLTWAQKSEHLLSWTQRAVWWLEHALAQFYPIQGFICGS